MDVFVARQPIFDRNSEVFAYELLFRSGPANCFPADTDPDHASSSVVSDGMLLMGLETLAGNKRAFINFTRGLLVNDFGSILPSEGVVVEVLETVAPDTDVVAACRRLKDAGYLLALDDVASVDMDGPLVDIADFVKVDFRDMPDPRDRAAIAARLRPRGIQLVAEKVETREEFSEAASAGYCYFQGYFFSEPVMVSAKSVPGFRLNYLRLMQQVSEPELDLDRLERIIKEELSMSYRVLRYINSAAFGLRQEVTSIRHALVLVGIKELRKWASAWTLANLGRDKPVELIICSLVRARFAELLGPLVGLGARAPELFMLGMFSMIDAVMDCQRDEIIATLPIAVDLKAALLGYDNQLKTLLDGIVAYERGDWEQWAGVASGLGVDEAAVPSCYLEATEWARHIFPR